MRTGIDYAWGGPPSRAALKRAHIEFVGRYFSLDPSKNIQAHEYQQLRRQGIEVIVAWETTAERARGNQHEGRWDAINAEAQRNLCGMPTNQIIYMAIDFDAQGPEIEQYFRGAGGILGARLGAYGGYRALKHLFDAGLIHHGWQTYAWSNGQWDARARVRQYSNGHQLGGVEVDYDVALDDRPVGPYVPADEARWISEYDRLLHAHKRPGRRLVLRRYMLRRRRLIWHLAQSKGGWTVLNRSARWRALLVRTE